MNKSLEVENEEESATTFAFRCNGLLAGCDYSKPENRDGFFFNTFVEPMDKLIHWLGSSFNNDYGLAIIVLVLAIRVVLLPFMLSNYKNSHMMREK